jgi:hypothetical protein
MNASNHNLPPPDVQAVNVTDDALTFELMDGRSITVPIVYYPTLMLATPAERNNFEICHSSVYWPDLDCDICSEHLLAGAKEAPYFVAKAYERAAQRKRDNAA